MRRSLAWWAAWAVLLAAGCAKHLPVPDLSFAATEHVVLTFRSGEEVEGKIAQGRRVELREPGVIWSARVETASDEQIVLDDLKRIRYTEGIALQAARQADARVDVDRETIPPKSFLRSEISKVDRVRVDIAKSARSASFWAYGVVVLTLLIGERS